MEAAVYEKPESFAIKEVPSLPADRMTLWLRREMSGLNHTADENL
jgi:hypothetical protein